MVSNTPILSEDETEAILIKGWFGGKDLIDSPQHRCDCGNKLITFDERYAIRCRDCKNRSTPN